MRDEEEVKHVGSMSLMEEAKVKTKVVPRLAPKSYAIIVVRKTIRKMNANSLRETISLEMFFQTS